MARATLVLLSVAAFVVFAGSPSALAQTPKHPDPPYYQFVSSACMYGQFGCSVQAQGGINSCAYDSGEPAVFGSPAGAKPDAGGNNNPPQTTGCLTKWALASDFDQEFTSAPNPQNWTMSGGATQHADPVEISADAGVYSHGNNGALVFSFVSYYQQNLPAPVSAPDAFTLSFTVQGHSQLISGIGGANFVNVCVWTDAPDFQCVLSGPPPAGELSKKISTPPVRVGTSGSYTILEYIQVNAAGDGLPGYLSVMNDAAFDDLITLPKGQQTYAVDKWAQTSFSGAVSEVARATPSQSPVAFLGPIGKGQQIFYDLKHPVVGFYTNAAGATEGFEDFGGKDVKSIVAPNDNVGFTRALGINSAGTIVGDFQQNYGGGVLRARGFLLNNGSFTIYDEGPTVYTDIYNINDNGDFVGSFSDGTFPSTGFLQKATGTLTTFGFPGATPGSIEPTFPAAVTSQGVIVGYFTDAGNNNHGFFRNTDGSMVQFDFPGAVSTEPLSITDNGTINGFFIDSSGTSHGFFGPLGFFVQYELQGASGAAPRILNSAGTVAGAYAGRGGVQDGFAGQLCAADISADVTATGGSFRADPSTGEVVQNIVLTNNLTVPIFGPIEILFKNLTPGVFLDNGNLTSICMAPGVQYVVVNVHNLPPGHQATATVNFVNDSGGNSISYQPIVVAGSQVP